MSERPWMKFYPTDWRGDAALRACSIAARGLWIELISLMHEAEPYGHLVVNGRAPNHRQVGAMLGATEREVTRLVAELETAGVLSRTQDGTIFSRRMVRDYARSGAQAVNGTLGGNPDIIRGTVPKADRVRPYRRSDSPEKTARILARSGGRCHWCRIELSLTAPGPNFFHVDHVHAVRDGGSNDEENLVAACASCNHKRARISWIGEVGPGGAPPSDTNQESGSDTNPDRKADTKPQSPEARNQNQNSGRAMGKHPSRARAHGSDRNSDRSEPPIRNAFVRMALAEVDRQRQREAELEEPPGDDGFADYLGGLRGRFLQ